MGLRFPLKFLLMLLGLLIFVAACQGSTTTEFVIEMTREVTRIVVVTATPEDGALTITATASTATATSELTPTATATESTVDLPDPIVQEIIVSEQQFERGRMFYLQPTDEIWVMFEDPNGLGGRWELFDNTWEEGMPELDPELETPEGLSQPIRGFGKLWRENDELREALGWALETEVGHVTTYRYEPGGEIVNGLYVAGPGQHVINSRDVGTTFIFDESTDRWSIAADPAAN
jgi:hypothetical protein